MEKATNMPCKKCYREVAALERLKLWDGEWYCCDCLNNFDCKFASYAKHFSQLHDKMPDLSSRGAFAYFVIALLTYTVLTSGLLISFLVRGNVLSYSGTGLLLLLLSVVGVVVGIVWGLVAKHVLRTRRLTISLKDGMIRAKWGNTEVMCPLKCGRCFIGRLWHVNIYGLQFFLPFWDRVLIISLPNNGRMVNVPVGFTPESWFVWKSLLQFSMVSHFQDSGAASGNSKGLEI